MSYWYRIFLYIVLRQIQPTFNITCLSNVCSVLRSRNFLAGAVLKVRLQLQIR